MEHIGNKLIIECINQLQGSLTKKLIFVSSFYLVRCPTSYERAQNTRLHR